MKLVVGLGNPGKEYAGTRHNAGFAAIDKLADALSLAGWRLDKKFNAEIIEGAIKKEKLILAKPATFMNNSGQAVADIMRFYKIKPRDLIVLHDDLDIAIGEFRLQTNRGPAGHNGVISIIEKIGTKDFTRVRLGVKSEECPAGDTAKFVLAKFKPTEKTKLNKAINEATEKIKDALC